MPGTPWTSPAVPGHRGTAPWPRLSLVPDPGCRQALQHRVSSRYPSADRRRGPVRHQGRGISGTPPRRQRPAVLQHLVRYRDQQLQGLTRLALDSAGHPGPSRRSPWPCLSLVPDPGYRQGLQHRGSSRYPSATRRRGPVRHQREGISGTPPRRSAVPGTPPGSAAAGDGHGMGVLRVI